MQFIPFLEASRQIVGQAAKTYKTLFVVSQNCLIIIKQHIFSVNICLFNFDHQLLI